MTAAASDRWLCSQRRRTRIHWWAGRCEATRDPTDMCPICSRDVRLDTDSVLGDAEINSDGAFAGQVVSGPVLELR